jgi:predicted SAM-dependent methyltransferase
MIRTFEFDDYPMSAKRLIRELDRLKEKFPAFKASVFAIPGAMTDKHWKPLLKRQEWVETCPHGLVHQKRECRQREIYSLRMHWLDKIAEEQRYTRLFKAPWHGMDERFMGYLVERNLEWCFTYLDWRTRFPTPSWKAWNLKDARMLQPYMGAHIEAHAIIPGRLRQHNRRHQQIDRRNLARITSEWEEGDSWEFVSTLTKPMVKKVSLGCGPHVWDGWDCLDNRPLDPRIIPWEAPEELPFIHNRVDVVLTSQVFNYFADEWYRPICREIFRILRPGGIVRLHEDATESGYVWRQPGQGARGTGTIRSLPTKRKVVKALRKAGFRVKLARPGRTQSPHKDVLQGDTRLKRWEKGHKYVLEGHKPSDLEPRP